MPSLPLHLFNTPRPTDFWQRHTIFVDQAQLVYRPNRGERGGEVASSATDIDEAIVTQDLIEQTIRNSRGSLAQDAFMVASGNVRSFNDAHPQLVKLQHPTVLTRGPAAISLRQLTHEFTQIERLSMLDGAAIHALCAPLSALQPKRAADLDQYSLDALVHLEADKARLTKKYAHVGHVVRAAHDHIALARKVVTPKMGLSVFKPMHIRALGDLHKAVKRSARAVQHDMLLLEQFGSRAASGSMQLKQATFEPYVTRQTVLSSVQSRLVDELKDATTQVTPGGEETDYPIRPMRLPNLFGPGEMRIDTAYTAMRMDNLFELTFKAIKTLNTQYLRPRASELAVVDQEMTQLLKHGTTTPVPLGPLGQDRLFLRKPSQSRE